MKRYRLTERFYKIIFSIGCLVVLACGMYKTELREHKFAELKVTYYTVASNDTLWNIAKTNCPNSIDCRDYVEAIKELNNISDIIHVDEVIKIYA